MLERQMQELRELPARVGGVESQILHQAVVASLDALIDEQNARRPVARTLSDSRGRA